MYEHNGKLLFKTVEGKFVVVEVYNENGCTVVVPTGETVSTTGRPTGTTRTTVDNFVIRHGYHKKKPVVKPTDVVKPTPVKE